MFEYESKHYDPKTDDLFLIYTAIDETINANGWKVEDIDKNITSGLGRPGVIKPKDPNNPRDNNQHGNFVHPEFPGASLVELLQNQESYSIARAVRLDKPSPGSDWRVWLHVTDPKAKLALKNASADYPRYISPQVITFPTDFPDEDRANSFKHWVISHWAFVDVPAYGEKMQVRGNCYGHINDCKIKLQNASTAGFCVAGAIKALSSSHNTNSPTENIMSDNNTASQPIQSNSQQVASTTPTTPGITYSWQPVTIPNNNQSVTTQQPSKQEREPDSENKPGQTGPESGPFVTNPPDKEEPKEAPLNKDLPASVPELQKMVVTQQELMRDLQKRFSALEKDNSVRKQTEQRYFAASKVARYANLFKSKDAFEKEVDVALRYSSVMSEQELEQYLADKFGKAVPVAKSAAAAIVAQPEVHEVPDFKQNNAAVVSSDNNRKFLELMDMFNTGGSS
jgi:hypothetical protein